MRLQPLGHQSAGGRSCRDYAAGRIHLHCATGIGFRASNCPAGVISKSTSLRPLRSPRITFASSVEHRSTSRTARTPSLCSACSVSSQPSLMSVSQTCFSSSGVSFGIDWDYLKKPSLERHQPRSVGSLARAVDGSLRNQKFRQNLTEGLAATSHSPYIRLRSVCAPRPPWWALAVWAKSGHEKHCDLRKYPAAKRKIGRQEESAVLGGLAPSVIRVSRVESGALVVPAQGQLVALY